MKKKKIIRILLLLLLCIVIGIVSYFGTLLIDKARKGNDVNINVTFDDTLTYVIPSTKTLSKEKAEEEWPYMMSVSNDGKDKGLYQIIIDDIETSTISRDKLDYSLYLDDKEISSGKLKDIKNNVLYTYEIEGKKTQRYKLYIWVNSEVAEDSVYEYKLTFNTIKTGGPGF